MFKCKNCCLPFLRINNKLYNLIQCNLNLRRLQSSKYLPANEENDPTISTKWQSAKPFEEIPTMSGLKLLRNILPGGQYHKLDVTQFLLALRNDLGDICKLPGTFGQSDIIITHNVDDFEEILRNEGIWPKRPGMRVINYHRSIHRANFFRGVEGLLASHGEKWSRIRSAVNPLLMQPKNVRLYLPKISLVNKEFVERIRVIRDPNTLEVPSTFEEDINRWALESVSVVALDKRLGLFNDNHNNARAKRMFATLNEFISLSFDIEVKPSIWRYYKTPSFNRVMKSLDSLLEATSYYIDEAIERLEHQRRIGAFVKPDHEKSVLEKLLKIDSKVATVMALDMLLAGIDTTTTTFTGILLSLAKNPDKQAKLRQEIMRILPDKNSEFGEEAFKDMPYLRACIKESLRYYPLVFGLSRAPNKNVVLSGYKVPKNTRVTMASVSLLRNEKHFARPNEYLPERWLRLHAPNLDSLKPSSPFVFLPFGFGPRTCVGRRVVEMELELGIARLVRNFYIDFKYPTKNAFKSFLINVPSIPLKFKFAEVEY